MPTHEQNSARLIRQRHHGDPVKPDNVMPGPLTTGQLHIDLADLDVGTAVDLPLIECPPLSRFVTHRTTHSHEASASRTRPEPGHPLRLHRARSLPN